MSKKLFLSLMLMVVGITVMFLVERNHIESFPEARESFGQFGDAFGALNTLFSGLAFAALIVTLWMQREELELQRKELVESRIAQQGAQEALEGQIKTMREQTMAIMNQTKSDQNLGRVERAIQLLQARITLRDLGHQGVPPNSITAFQADIEKLENLFQEWPSL